MLNHMCACCQYTRDVRMYTMRRFESIQGVFSMPHHTAHTWRQSNTQHTPHHTKKEDIEWLRGRQEKEDRDRDRRYDEWEHNTRQDKTRQGKMKETKTEIMMGSDAESKFTQEKAKRANSNPPGINLQKKWESWADSNSKIINLANFVSRWYHCLPIQINWRPRDRKTLCAFVERIGCPS